MRPSERLVANFVLGRPSVVIYMSIADLAERADVSEPTIMRFCKAIGCLGFMEFKLALVRDLERRTFAMNRTNPAVKGPAGFGQALFGRVIAQMEGVGDTLPLDRIDEILEWFGVSRAISFVHDGSESDIVKPLIDELLTCRLEANSITDLTQPMRFDGRVIIALKSAIHVSGFDAFCQTAMLQGGKIVSFGFTPTNHSLALDVGANDRPFGGPILYLALAETLRLGVEARLSRTGAFADTATDHLQSQREIAYGDARRRDRQSAELNQDNKEDQQKNETRPSVQNGETA